MKSTFNIIRWPLTPFLSVTLLPLLWLVAPAAQQEIAPSATNIVAEALVPDCLILRDDFEEGDGYGTNDGDDSFTGPWVETGDDGSPTSGDIEVSGTDALFTNPDPGAGLERPLDLTGNYGSAKVVVNTTISSSSNYGPDDLFRIQMSDDGGVTFTTIATVLATDYNEPNGSFAGRTETFSYGINQFIGEANVVFRVEVEGFDNTAETIFFDFIEIYACPLDVTVMTAAPSPACDGTGGIGSMTVIGYNGVPPFEYAIDGGAFQTSNLFENLAVGPHLVAVRDANGLTASETLSIPEETGPVFAEAIACPVEVLNADRILVEEFSINITNDNPTVTPSDGSGSTTMSVVSGEVLNSDNTPAGFGYSLTATVSGGPTGNKNGPVNFPYNAPETSTVLSRNLRIDAGPALTVSVFQDGTDNLATGSTTEGSNRLYYRDPTSQVLFDFRTDVDICIAAITYTIGDVDYNFGTYEQPGSADNNEGEINNYNNRQSYIDRIRVLTGVGTNTYDPGSGIRVEGDILTAAFPDANNDGYPDFADDGRLGQTDPASNLTVTTAGPLANLRFIYSDASVGIEGDPDRLHDFDSGNQFITVSAPLNFSVFRYQFCAPGSVMLTTCDNLTNITWFNEDDVQVGTGAAVEITEATAGLEDGSSGFYYTATSPEGCDVRSCLTLVDALGGPATVEAGEPETFCQTDSVVLADIGASFTSPDPDRTATFTTSGDGTFSGGAEFGSARAYIFGEQDILDGTVTLSLTAEAADDICEPQTDDVEITILKVDCGTFPWPGGQ